MAVSPAAALAGGILLASGAALLALRRPSPLSAALFALVALWGAATLTGSAMAHAPDDASAAAYARITLWYSVPLPLLMLAVGPPLLGARPLPRVALVLGAVATLAALAPLALAPALYLDAVPFIGDAYGMRSGPLLYVLTAALALTEAALALRAAARANDPAASQLDRERALWVGAAFGIMPLHAAGFFVSFILSGPSSLAIPAFWGRAVPTLLAGAAAAYALARLVRAAAPASRRRGIALSGVVLALGLLDGLVGAQRLANVPYAGYEQSQLAVRVAFALLLGVAALRYGLAGAGADARRRVERTSGVLTAVLVGVVLAATLLAVLGASLPSLAATTLLAVAIPFAMRRPFEAIGASAARALLLPPEDPRAVAERARTYAAAVAASQGAGAEGERYLAAMRADLGIRDTEHELLVHGLSSRERPRYQSVETLGQGATSKVDLAVDEVGGKRVVVKRFLALRDPAAALREARALAAVRHPRIVPFLEVDRRDDGLYLVLAYAEGGSARQLLDREGPLPVMRAVGLAADLLEGLEALHAAGIVHCDVKPENLLLDANGRGMLGDFGSAKFAAPDLADATLAGGAAEGSLSTISPEALRGAPPAPARDVYAAGALLYRLLTGEHYLDLRDATVFEARERILLDPPRLPHARVPPAVEAVLRRALAKRPEQRFGSAEEMREALLRAAARAPIA